jgi:hypothetical protein
MAKIRYYGKIEQYNKNPENKIQQGDFVYCETTSERSLSFWGIYSRELGVISLDGAGNSYIAAKDAKDLYLYDTSNSWRITKRIKNNNAIIIIDESN